MSTKKTSPTQHSCAFGIHTALRDARPELDGHDVAFLLAVSGYLGLGLKPTVVKSDEFRVALSTIQSFLRTGKSKVVASRKKLEQLGIITVMHPGNSADHIPATYRINVNSIGTGVPGQNADTCMAGFRGKTPRGSDAERRGVPTRDGMDLWDLSGDDKKMRASHVDADATDASSTITMEQVRNMIAQDVDLARITTSTDVDEIARAYLASADRIDVARTIRSAGNYLRTDAGKKFCDGKDHLLRRLGWAIDVASRKKPQQAAPAHVLVDLAQHPELLPPVQQGARFRR